jgi:hypothetical protein
MERHILRATLTIIDYILVGILLNNAIEFSKMILDKSFNLEFIPGIEIYFYLYCPVIIALLQKFNFSSLGLINNEKLVRSNGKNVTLVELFIRALIKPFLIGLYVAVPIFWILYPLLKFFDSANTPFDNIFGTTVVKIERVNPKNNFFKTIFPKTFQSNFFLIYHKTKTWCVELWLKFHAARQKPNFEKKLLSIYIIWISIHFILFLFSQKLTLKDDKLYLFVEGIDHFSVNKYLFFPFETCRGDYVSGVYDESEFIIYTLIPVVIYISIKLWKNTTK